MPTYRWFCNWYLFEGRIGNVKDVGVERVESDENQLLSSHPERKWNENKIQSLVKHSIINRSLNKKKRYFQILDEQKIIY